MADSGFRLGIDFGTSNTVAVLRWPDGRVKSLLFDGSPLLPSAVYLEPQGGILSGKDAVHSSRLQPHRFEPYPKRRIDEGTLWLGDREIDAIQLVSTVLRRVATEAVRVAGALPREVAITHPAAWGPHRRDALIKAAAAAGLPTPQLAAEPVAAACYFVGTVGTHVPVGGCAVVYDFGAGTFDASVVRRTAGGSFEVLSSEGLADAGGLDVDATIVAHLGELLSERHPAEWARLRQPESETDRRSAWQLWEDVRLAKEMLSRAATTYVHVPILDESVPLGREELEQLARPILDRTVTATQLAIASAGIANQQISAVFLVGGSSRIPLCATLLHRQFGIAATAIEQPELVVAEGALQLSPPTGRASVGAPLGSSPAASPMPGPGQPPPAGTGSTRPVSAAPVSGSPSIGAPISGVPVSPALSGMAMTGPTAPPRPPASPVRPTGPTAAQHQPGPPMSAPARPAGWAQPAGPPRPPAGPPVGYAPPGYPARPVPVAAQLPPPAPPAAAARGMSTAVIVTLVVAGLVVLLGGGGALAVALWPTGGGSPTNGPTRGGGGGASPACGYKIAYLGVLSGDNSGDGVNVRDSVRMAIDQYNQKHSGCQTQLVEFDSKYDTDTSTTLAGQIAADNKILGVIGPVYKTEIDGALPVLDKAGVTTITPSASEPELSSSGWHVFHRMLGTDIDQADAGARYLTSIGHATKVAVVADDSAYGASTGAEVNKVLGGKSTGIVSIKRDAKDFAAAVTEVTKSGADWVYLAAYYDDGGAFVKQLRASNTTIKIAAGDRVFTDTFVTTAGKAAAEGAVVTCSCIPAGKARNGFADQFKAQFGRAASYYGPEAFDATNILLAGMNAGNGTRADLLRYVNAYDAEGVSRRIRFSSRGDLATDSLQVWAYKVNDGFVAPDQVIP